MEKNKNKPTQRRVNNAFTLIELLVVIAIIGILAALITNLAGKAATSRKLARVQVELAQLETAIDAYKEKKGSYPPSNSNANNAVTNQLFYELTGVINNPEGTTFTSLALPETIDAATVKNFFGPDGFANSSADKSEVKNFFPAMKSSQYAQLSTLPVVEVLTVPVEGPNDIDVNGKKINPWRYQSPGTHNPESYDLWADIVVAGKTNKIGNWKD